MTIALPVIGEDLAPTGTLRASINLGNPVLAQGTATAPTGVTVELAREVAARLDVPVALLCFDAALKSFEAITAGQADIGFLAIEPEREAKIAFTAPYVLIEGVFVVPQGSAITGTAEVDHEGVRVGVNRGSAYDLFLSRTLQRAEVVRADEGIAAFRELGLEVAAGVRQPMAEFVDSNPGYRLIDDRFMVIRQALGTTRDRRPETVRFLHSFIEELKASGFIAAALRRANQPGAAVAPPG
jgi:polar amino acid transport system substrate-binding protein